MPRLNKKVKNGKTKIDVAVLQEQVKRIDENVIKIMDNHIPHLHDEIDAMKMKMAYYAGGVAVVTWIIAQLWQKI